MKNLNKHVGKVLEEHRLDHYIKTLIDHVPWDDLMLAFSNVCVYHANDHTKQDSKEYKAWYKRAYIFHKCITDGRKATVQKRKVKKVLDGTNTTAEGGDS
jgi:hypothetical protein